MEETTPQPTFLEGEIVGIRFGLATHKEISTASVSECPISHSTQLTNPFLGLPLEFGKCESCGTSEVGECEGHFGYIELPIPIYHPSHVMELKRLLNMLCLKCLKIKRNKVQMKPSGIAERMLSCCEEASQVSVQDVKAADGACFLQLKTPSRSKVCEGSWNFLDRYGFRYGHGHTRMLLPCEAMEMLKRISEETRKKLHKKGYFPQEGYILRYLPVPPNCLSVPDISDGVSVMSADLSISVLKKVLRQIEVIKSSRSGPPNFQSHEIEVNDLQSAVDQYLQVRGTAKSSRDVDGARFGVKKESTESATKAWLEKIRTLFIRKGSGFSSRTVITGDAYTLVNQIGIPREIAQRITIEERVNHHNIKLLQELVDNKQCLTFRDGSSTYSLREGSKGHTFLRMGQIVHRRIMDGDMVFVNRPPTTHKHSLQALSVYVHDEHVVKINPLICGPLSADFDGDCIHLFYPQSVAAKAEVLELFSVEKQLVSSHSGNLILQLSNDSLLSLKLMLKSYFFNKAATQQLLMFLSKDVGVGVPALLKAKVHGPYWTALQILQSALPDSLECSEDRYLISKSNFIKLDYDREVLHNILNELATSIFFQNGPEAVLEFFNAVQPLLMENLVSRGFSMCLKDFSLFENIREQIQKDFEDISPLLGKLRSSYDELLELQIENHINKVKQPVVDFTLRFSALGDLIHSKSESGFKKVVEQIGFLGLQISDRGKLYTKGLVQDISSLFENKYPCGFRYPSAQYGLIRNCFFRGLDPYEGMVHSISSREVILRSSRGLSEPGTLFKNLMAILRDVVICYDGTVRNVCSQSIIQFQYGVTAGTKSLTSVAAGEPVGVLAATAMSNPAYKAVLDSTPSSNSSWGLMKEILLCKVGFKNDLNDRRVILYLNECGCGRNYCQERAAYLVKNHLEKVSLKDIAESFMIEFKRQPTGMNDFGIDSGLVGHIHLRKEKLEELKIGMDDVQKNCQDALNLFGKKKQVGRLFKMTTLSVSDGCAFHQSGYNDSFEKPCLMFCLGDTFESNLENTIELLADRVCPVLMEAIVKGDQRVSSANIIWASPETTSWIRNPSRTPKGELALDVVLEKQAVKGSGDAWRTVLNSCLPVLHLVDTTRSVPYAIKQVQELLGISCAFDQAVQRLSTSVAMVAKGVLKEHLFLLANSMTCAGNLIGFNSGGYKALSRSLDVQVPFTEATLFTPRKCFETAAEKCHVDALSSIVASCSWGRPVAVGTGSRFDILWDKKESSLNQDESVDVYSFLNMVRTGKDGEEQIPGSLGVEVDDLIPEDEMEDWNLSPEHNSGAEKPTFEDSAELIIDNGVSSWDVGTGKEEGSSGWGAAATKKQEESDKFGWDMKVTSSGQEEADGQAWSGWGAAATEKPEESGWNSKAIARKEPEKQQSWSALGGAASKEQEESGKSVWDSKATTSGAQEETGGWGAAGTRKQVSGSDWAAAGPPSAQEETGGWGAAATRKHVDTDKSSWDKSAAWQKSEKFQPDRSGSDWAVAGPPSAQEETGGWGAAAPRKQVETDKSSWDKTAAWQKSEKFEPDRSGSDWVVAGPPSAQEETGGWGAAAPRKQVETDKSSWDKSAAWQNPELKSQSWGAKKPVRVGSSAANVQEESPRVGDANPGNWGRKVETGDTSWKSKSTGWDSLGSPQTNPDGQNESSPGWGLPKATSGSDGWGVSTTGGGGQSNPDDKNETSHGWGVPKASSGSDGWGVPNTRGDNLNGGRQQWRQNSGEFKKDRPEGSRGWSKNPDWKNPRKNYPPKSPGFGNEESGMFTATRHRVDIFTTEEQDILALIEPLMLSIRRIMHNTGYNDGDPLSAVDQSYIVDKVFNYHPDKAAKMGSGLDHITVGRHTNFQESRCFHVVTTDGSRQDFSYRKCLENFIKEKFPERAEEFNGKYFAKRSGGGGNRQQQQRKPESPSILGSIPETPLGDSSSPFPG